MISLCTFVKNEEHCLEHMLSRIAEHVNEIVIVDTGSTDATMQVAKKFDARIYEVGFTDFGKMRTLTAHLAREPWVLMLDADETLENPEALVDLANDAEVEAYAFPRKRWLDLGMQHQTETEAYPDWQVRFFRNETKYVWRRELHEYFDGGAVVHIPNGPVVNHFQDVFKSAARKQERDELYRFLALQAGVDIVGGKPL